ncbi:MAG TPA: hypothetical protein DCF33_00195 [Saprospirales bacterium]|nr:hypothetical protein [Saprospirales bacterium]
MYGLILAGGQSSRMGQPKSLIDYHGKPQYLFLLDLLMPYCEEVFISCKPEQEHWFSPCPTLPDNGMFGDIGPMGGVLSAFEVYDGPWLVVGCDYPYLTSADIVKLILSRSEQFDTVCYRHPTSGMDEPLTAIYENTCADQLTHSFRSGQHSLRHFLAQTRVNRIEPLTIDHLRSIDTPE